MIISTIVICVIGTLLHFTYELSNHNKVVGLFSAVNESTWEHTKIALSATLFYSLIDLYLCGSNVNYFFAKFISLLILVVLIPLIFYLYKSILKKPNLIFDIVYFYIVIFISNYAFYKILSLSEVTYLLNYLSIIGVFLVFAFYMRATLLPLKNEIFKDPITNKYGIKGHTKH